jgi:hypothetical protein
MYIYRQEKVIDVIGVDKKTGEVILTVSDHLSWEDEMKHLLLLQEKINSYLAFIESGEILESYPDAKNRSPVISIKAMHEPSAEALRFFAKVKNVAAGAGIGFQYAHTPLAESEELKL